MVHARTFARRRQEPHGRHVACLRGHRTRGTLTSVSVSVRSAGLPSQAVSGTVSIGRAASHTIKSAFMGLIPARAPSLRGHRTRGTSVSVRSAGLPSQAASGTVLIGGAASLAAMVHARTFACMRQAPAFVVTERGELPPLSVLSVSEVLEVLACQVKQCLAQCRLAVQQVIP